MPRQFKRDNPRQTSTFRRPGARPTPTVRRADPSLQHATRGQGRRPETPPERTIEQPRRQRACRPLCTAEAACSACDTRKILPVGVTPTPTVPTIAIQSALSTVPRPHVNALPSKFVMGFEYCSALWPYSSPSRPGNGCGPVLSIVHLKLLYQVLCHTLSTKSRVITLLIKVCGIPGSKRRSSWSIAPAKGEKNH